MSNAAKIVKICTHNLFQQVVTDHARFKVVYGYGMDVEMMNYVVVRTTTYTDTSYMTFLKISTLSHNVGVKPQYCI